MSDRYEGPRWGDEDDAEIGGGHGADETPAVTAADEELEHSQRERPRGVARAGRGDPGDRQRASAPRPTTTRRLTFPWPTPWPCGPRKPSPTTPASRRAPSTHPGS